MALFAAVWMPLAAAPARAPGLAACDGPASAEVLHPAMHAADDARALWLDRRLLRWPGARVTPGDRFRLYHSAQARLVAPVGGRVRGADGRLTLTPADEAVPAALAERFRYAGAGPVLAIPDTAHERLPALLRGQLLLVHEDAAGRVRDATHVQLPGALDDLYATATAADDLGVRLRGGTAFALWAPTARAVAVCLYPDGDGRAVVQLALAHDPVTGIWRGRVPQDRRGDHYTYLVEVYVPGHGVVRNRVTDPYSVGLGADSRRSYIADLDDPALKPPGWDAAPRPAPLAAQTDLVIYELHVRDFSRDDASVPPADRGKYLAFTHPDTVGMRHLRTLRAAGLTDVHLLPVFDFATVPETGCVNPQVPQAPPDSPAQQAAVLAQATRDCFNWGYDPYHFNTPEGSYASDARDGAVRIREFRAMVQALHAVGLRVGMDVVYNHTTASGQAETSVLDRIVPGYYHRLDAQGRVERSTCCANTATEHAMMAKLMRDSVLLWATQYRVDSFRFDLMGHQPRAAMEVLQAQVNAATGRHVPLIGEGWNFGEVADGARFVQAAQLSLHGAGIATFSDRARDAIRGGGPADRGAALLERKGYVNGAVPSRPDRQAPAWREALHTADLVRAGLAGTLRDYRMVMADGVARPLAQLDYRGQPAGYAAQPGEVVNYVENHDNQTLYDLNVFKLPRDTPPAERARVQLLAAALTAFSQGVAYFHAGIELLRSKSLDRNSFDSGDWFNRYDPTGAEHGFGAGLPPAPDNGADWPLMRPLLADPALKPGADAVTWMRAAFLDLLRIRDSSTLFRLRTAADVQQRLRFYNTGPDQDPALIAAHLDGADYPGARFRALLVLVNVAPQARTLRLPDQAGKRYVLHPVQRAEDAADPRPRTQARYDARTGRFTVPARTAVVYVLE